ERDAMGDLPPAEGVPNQQDWDPLAQLAELRRKQEEILVALARRGTERDVPKRMLVRSSVALPGDEASSSSSGTVKDTKGNSVKQAADAAEDEDEEPGASQSWSNIPPRRKFEERHAHFDI
ncbi:MAG: hypothetical protein Q9228_007780, partial [Teloschistes exilis]